MFLHFLLIFICAKVTPGLTSDDTHMVYCTQSWLGQAMCYESGLLSAYQEVMFTKSQDDSISDSLEKLSIALELLVQGSLKLQAHGTTS